MRIPKLERSKLNIVTTLSNQLIATLCGIIVPRALLKAFGSDAYGITVSITQFLSYIALLESGIGGVARAKLYAPLANGDSGGVSSVYYAVKTFFRYVAAIFFAYSIILALSFHDIAHVTAFSRPYIFALVLVMSLSTLATYMGGLADLTLISADQKQYIGNLILSATTVLNTLAVVILIGLRSDLLSVKIWSSLIFVMRPIMYSIYVRRHYALSRSARRATLDQKWTGVGQHIAYFLHSNTDVVLLTIFASTRLVAVYSIYSMIVGSIRAITTSFSGGMEARFGELIAKGKIDDLRRSYARYDALLRSVSIVLFSCTGVLILPFVRLYTRGIMDENYIRPAFSVILLLAEAVNCLALPCSALPVAAGQFKQTRMGAYGEAAINIILSCFLIFWDPLCGVAIGTLAATVFRAVYYTVYSARNLLRVPIKRLLLKFAVSLAAMCAIIFLGRAVMQHVVISNYWQWALCGTAAFIIIALPFAIKEKNKI